LNFQINK
jgi:hypothetical protein